MACILQTGDVIMNNEICKFNGKQCSAITGKGKPCRCQRTTPNRKPLQKAGILESVIFQLLLMMVISCVVFGSAFLIYLALFVR